MSGIWSGDTRCVVMLGFDVDGVSSALNSNPDTAKLPSFMSMREYGPSVAAPRILDVLEKLVGVIEQRLLERLDQAFESALLAPLHRQREPLNTLA